MTDFAIMPGRHGIPHHAFKQADGRYILCPRRVELCKACKEHGVPPIPPDPFQAAVDLVRANWSRRWRERYRVPLAGVPEHTIRPDYGAHIMALSDDGEDVTIIGHFGDNERVMTDLAALVRVHNEMIGEGR